MFNKWGNIFGGIISNGYGVLRDIEIYKFKCINLNTEVLKQ